MIETLGNLGEFISGIAVLATLIYLSVQVRQNTKATKASSFHQVQREFNSWLISLARSSEMADILLKGNITPSSLNDLERVRYFGMIMTNFHVFETLYTEFCEGTASKEQWESEERSFIRLLALPGVQYYLDQHPWLYTARFRTYFERMLREEAPKLSTDSSWETAWYPGKESS